MQARQTAQRGMAQDGQEYSQDERCPERDASLTPMHFLVRPGVLGYDVTDGVCVQLNVSLRALLEGHQGAYSQSGHAAR